MIKLIFRNVIAGIVALMLLIVYAPILFGVDFIDIKEYAYKVIDPYKDARLTIFNWQRTTQPVPRFMCTYFDEKCFCGDVPEVVNNISFKGMVDRLTSMPRSLSDSEHMACRRMAPKYAVAKSFYGDTRPVYDMAGEKLDVRATVGEPCGAIVRDSTWGNKWAEYEISPEIVGQVLCSPITVEDDMGAIKFWYDYPPARARYIRRVNHVLNKDNQYASSILQIKKLDIHTTAIVTMYAYDGDHLDEGIMLINGNEVQLFGDDGKDQNDNIWKYFAFVIPVEYLVDGDNKFEFKWLGSVGYKITEIDVNLWAKVQPPQ